MYWQPFINIPFNANQWCRLLGSHLSFSYFAVVFFSSFLFLARLNGFLSYKARVFLSASVHFGCLVKVAIRLLVLFLFYFHGKCFQSKSNNKKKYILYLYLAWMRNVLDFSSLHWYQFHYKTIQSVNYYYCYLWSPWFVAFFYSIAYSFSLSHTHTYSISLTSCRNKMDFFGCERN